MRELRLGFHCVMSSGVCCGLVGGGGSDQQGELIYFSFHGVTELILATAVAQVRLYISSRSNMFGCLLGSRKREQTNRSCLTRPASHAFIKTGKISAFILSTTFSFKLGHCEIMSWLLLTFSLGLSLIIVREEHTAQLISWINI